MRYFLTHCLSRAFQQQVTTSQLLLNPCSPSSKLIRAIASSCVSFGANDDIVNTSAAPPVYRVGYTWLQCMFFKLMSKFIRAIASSSMSCSANDGCREHHPFHNRKVYRVGYTWFQYLFFKPIGIASLNSKYSFYYEAILAR